MFAAEEGPWTVEQVLAAGKGCWTVERGFVSAQSGWAAGSEFRTEKLFGPEVVDFVWFVRARGASTPLGTTQSTPVRLHCSKDYCEDA